MLLQVRELHVHFRTPEGVVPAVAGVSLELDAGQTLALVGESGCGKSVTALSVLRLLPSATARVVAGSINFNRRDLLTLSEREMRSIRGDRIAMIFQNPLSSLNPLLTAGQQIEEALGLHRRLSKRGAREQALGLLRQAGVPAPEQRLGQYPHELSGGLCQRVMIAMALACEPELLIADEPTTALDVTIQAQILALLRELQRRTGLAILFITHDLGLVAELADAVCVMYAGRIVERASVARLFSDPRHPYTRGLLRCSPRLDAGAASGRGNTRTLRLPVIPGEMPDPRRRPAGCPFHPRCELGRSDLNCRSVDPPLCDVEEGQLCACWKAPGYPLPAVRAGNG